ncbi:MAG: CotH kinase family protein [Candidatus Izemoplasmataceae bacterium]
MKKLLLLSLIFIVGLSLAACRRRSGTVITFEDPNLSLAIREHLNQRFEEIYLEDVIKITTLDATGYGIFSLEGIEQLTALNTLILEDNFIEDVSPLQSLEHLTHLNLRNNEITSLETINFDAITHLSLKHLNLRHNVYRPNPNDRSIQARLSDISLLSEMYTLEFLSLRDNFIEDISPLEHLTHLIELDLSENSVENQHIELLYRLIQLEHLNIRETNVTKIDVVSRFTQLRYLNIHSNTELETLEPIKNLVNLETLIATNVPLFNEIDYLENLTNLKRLNIENTQVSDIRVLGRLMAKGALQDIPASNVEAEVNLNNNPIPIVKEDSLYGFNPVRPYWDNITHKTPNTLPGFPSASVMINEFMASNGSSLADSDGDFEDWIELYNPNNTAYDLSHYYLSDSDDNPLKWQFPDNITIPANGYLVIFASGKDKVTAQGEIHTNFKISLEGEPLLLTSKDAKTLIDYVLPVLVPRDMSYGRLIDGGDIWGYFDYQNISPNASNNTMTPFDLENNELPMSTSFNIEPFDRLFNDNVLKSFTIQISEEEWLKYDQEMLNYASLFNGELRTDYYARVNLIYEDHLGSVVIEDVGFRTRGNLSRVRIQNDDGALNLSHFKFSFDEDFNDASISHNRNRNVFELEEIDLKFNRNWDSTYLTEKFSMDLFNAYGVYAAYTTLANIYVQIGNETHFYGVYTLFEPIDKNFLERRFDDAASEGNLYKNLWQQYGPAALQHPIPNNALGIKDTSINYRPAYDLKTNKDSFDTTSLEQFIYQINRLNGSAFKTYIEEHFEVDLFLKLMAVGVLLGNPDDYRAMGNNYYFYHNPVTNKFMMIPYDYDHGMAQGWDASPVFSNWTVGANIYTWGNVNKHLLGVNNYPHPLSDKILSIPEYQIIYESHLRELIDPANNLFSFNHFNQVFETQKAMYDPFVDQAMMNQRFGLRNIEWYINAKVADVQQQLTYYYNNPSKRGL